MAPRARTRSRRALYIGGGAVLAALLGVGSWFQLRPASPGSGSAGPGILASNERSSGKDLGSRELPIGRIQVAALATPEGATRITVRTSAPVQEVRIGIAAGEEEMLLGEQAATRADPLTWTAAFTLPATLPPGARAALVITAADGDEYESGVQDHLLR